MKIWYRAVCDTHKEACHIFVNNPICSYDYLKDYAQDIQDFMSTHYGCNLRLVAEQSPDYELILEEYFIWDKGFQ